MLFLLSWFLLQSSWAAPGGTPPDSLPVPTVPGVEDRCTQAPPDPQQPFPDAFKRARRIYLSGCHAEALLHFRALQVRARSEHVQSSLSARTQQFLGEVQYMLGEKAAAMKTFESLLREQPQRRISPLDHHPSVVELYQIVQALVQATPVDPPDPAPIERRPWWTIAPYGTTWFQQKRGKTGRWFLTGQLAAGAVAAGTFAYGRSRWPGDVVDETQLARSRTMRGINWAANGTIVGLWVISQFEARRVYRRDFRATPVVTPTQDGGASVGVQGRF